MTRAHDWEGEDVNARLEALESTVEGLRDTVAALAHALEAQQDDHARLVAILDTLPGRIEFAQRLQAFFGPMLEGKTPPLDGEDVASRGYVDESIARLARALRREQAAAPATQRSKASVKRRR